jgi:hypothetical protein
MLVACRHDRHCRKAQVEGAEAMHEIGMSPLSGTENDIAGGGGGYCPWVQWSLSTIVLSGDLSALRAGKAAAAGILKAKDDRVSNRPSFSVATTI